MAQFVRRQVGAAAQRAALSCPDTEQWAKDHPAVWEYLTLEQWEDGAARQTSMLCIFYEGDLFKGCLQDRDAGRSLWASGASPEAVLRSLEAMLATGQGEWRVARSGPYKGRNGKR